MRSSLADIGVGGSAARRNPQHGLRFAGAAGLAPPVQAAPCQPGRQAHSCDGLSSKQRAMLPGATAVALLAHLR